MTPILPVFRGRGVPVYVGVDGGASKALAVAVGFNEQRLARVVARSGRIGYAREPGFRPVALEQQLEERRSGKFRITEEERRRGRSIVRAVARAIVRVTNPKRHAWVGLSLAGLKTPDGGGIAVCANGARMPEFASDLERELRRSERPGIRLILPLSSDGYCSGLGELTRVNGRLRTVANAYYAGAGTGLAEAVKLDNALVSMDEVASWFPKAWEMEGWRHERAEHEVSASALMHLYAGAWTSDGGMGNPLSAALRGEEHARTALVQWARAWGRFVSRRLVDWATAMPNHPLQRVVIGQRAGIALAAPGLRSFFRIPLEQEFSRLARSARPKVGGYEDGDRLKRGFIVASPVLEVPAIGAAVLALAASTDGNQLRE
jgi:hypothetical protein